MNLEDRVETAVLLDHLRTSLNNIQDVIKFVDTKTAFLTGLVTVTLAFPLLLARYFLGEPFDGSKLQAGYDQYPVITVFAIFTLICSLICGIFSIYCSLSSLVARPPSIWTHNSKIEKVRFCILFPFHTPAHATSAKEYYSKIVTGMTNEELLGEYQFQMEQLGGIVERKISWHRRSATLFVGQLILPAMIIVPLTILQTAGRLLKSFFSFIGTQMKRSPK